MNYRLECVPEFTVLAKIRSFDAKNAAEEIPKFWEEYYRSGNGAIACGQFGICFGGSAGGTFHYGIGNRCEVEQKPDGATVCHVFNCPDLTRIPDGFEVRTIPAQTWLKVEARGALPKSIQSTYPEIEKEWPGGLERIYGMDIEEYGCCETPEDSQKDDYLCRIWIPVKLLGTEHYSVKTDVLTASEFNRLGCAAGWEMPSEKQSAAALRNSLVTFSLYNGGTLIGMARLIGDRAMAYMVREVVVLPEFQKQGAGTFLMLAVQQWIARDVPDGWRASCELFAAEGQRDFYQHCGFVALPHSGNENGMSTMIIGQK